MHKTAILALFLAATGCNLVLGVSDPGLDRFRVRGVAAGVVRPVTLELMHADGTESMTITTDGAFAFETELEDGASYSVQSREEAPCTIERAAGVIEAGDAELAMGCSLLADLQLSGPTVTPMVFEPGVTVYEVDVSVLQQAMAVTATERLPGTTIVMAGEEVATGKPSAAHALALGETELAVEVSREDWSETYRIAVIRAGAIAEVAYGKASDTIETDYFGYALALSGDTLAVGAYAEDSGATGVDGDQANYGAVNSGAVYVFRRTGSAWVQEAYLKASNTGASDSFGYSVAVSGDTLAVGAHAEDSAATGVNGSQDDNSVNAGGAVYVYRRTGSAWVQEAYVKASNTGVHDYFGYSVAVSGDILAVGAYGEGSAATGVNSSGQNDNSVERGGAVYVFRRTGNTWAQEAYVKASNTDANDYFGYSVAVSGDTVAVGAYGEDSRATGVNGGDEANNGASASGAVYVFRRTGNAWAQEAYIKASNTDANDHFGFSVAVSGDTLAVGAYGEDSAARGVNTEGEEDNTASGSGAVYIFRRIGIAWIQEAYVKASNPGVSDFFGYSVAVSKDTLAVGARNESSGATGVDGAQADDSAGQSGAVYVFVRTGLNEGMWAQEAYVKASNTGATDYFGYSVAVSEDAFAVGAYGEDSATTGIDGTRSDNGAIDSGAVYIFH